VSIAICLYVILFFVTVQHLTVLPSGKTLSDSSQRTFWLFEVVDFSDIKLQDTQTASTPSNAFTYFELFFAALILVSVVWTVLFNFYVTYSKGADPLGADSVEELNSILDSSKSSTVSANPGTVRVSYLSPSNVILTSIQRFNAASACSGDDAAAAGASMHV
jgi:hypothetical protein